MRHGIVLKFAGALAALFGLASIASGGGALFGGEAARAMAGNAVPFVLWFNFLAGFAYVAAGAGMFAMKRWAFGLAAAIAVATILVFFAFAAHVMTGGAYEMRTVGAMTLRSVFWIAMVAAAWRLRYPDRSIQSGRTLR